MLWGGLCNAGVTCRPGLGYPESRSDHRGGYLGLPSLDVLHREKIHLFRWHRPDHVPQNREQFRSYELFSSGIFHIMCLDCVDSEDLAFRPLFFFFKPGLLITHYVVFMRMIIM